MIPDADGRYCSHCSKTVTDFSAMSDYDIQQYFIQHHSEPICGHFKTEQVQRIVVDLPHNVFQINMPFWKKFMVAALIVFGSSVFPFETTIAGKKPETISYSQQNISNSTKDKKPGMLKKKKYRYRIKLSNCAPDFKLETISGFTVTYPAQPSIDSTILYPKKTSRSNIAAISETKENFPAKKEPTPTPPVSTEFILPALLLNKRKN